MKNLNLILLIFLFYSCGNEAAKIEQRKGEVKQHITTLFNLIKSWKTQEHNINETLERLDSLLTEVDINKANSNFSFEFQADSIKYLTPIITQLDLIAYKKTTYNNALFWSDTTTTGLDLLRYTLYPNPTAKQRYTLEVFQRNQE